MINIIVAMDKQGLIGVDNRLPWELKEDLRYFKKVTTSHVIVMGRKTWESLPKKPLPNRINVVFSRNNKSKLESNKAILSHQTLESILEWATEEEVFIIGGAEIYKLFYSHCDKLYITYVNDKYEGNIYFPIKISQINDDFEIESRELGKKCEFIVMRRKYEEN